MNLIIDQGNTSFKIALFENGQVVQKARYQHFEWEQLQKDFNLEAVKKGIFASVGQQVPHLNHLSFPMYYLSVDLHLPFTLNYKTPATLGTDRIALAGAACTTYPGKDCLVIDAGTCITYDFINKAGEYLGGAISPGVEMRYKALHHYTARLPLLQVAKDNAVELIGDSTESSIHSGVVNGVKNELARTIERYKERFPEMVTVITGGNASLFADFVKNDIFAAPEFLLQGLNNILDYHAEKI